ncbi:hypothetical protein GCM10023143_06400 [Compostibacter hankyongensis]|uniref:Uncharacterized protein n=1 Tax=Compostibacter hankyongensis TaxID=1007089 RepID=A0ABP8FGC9_9BACT
MPLRAQHLSYSASVGSFTTYFRIAGKCGQYLFIYKSRFGKDSLIGYTGDMQEAVRQPLKFLPQEVDELEFIAYPDHIFLYCVYRQRNELRCMTARLDSLGRLRGRPAIIDRMPLREGLQVARGIGGFRLIKSAGQERMMILGIREPPDSPFCRIRTFLLGPASELLHRGAVVLPWQSAQDQLNSLLMADGTLLFVRGSQAVFDRGITRVMLFHKPPEVDLLYGMPCPLDGRAVSPSMMLKAGVRDGCFWWTAWAYNKSHRFIAGLYTCLYNYRTRRILIHRFSPLGTRLWREQKGRRHAASIDFEACRFRDLIFDRGGHGILFAEDAHVPGSRRAASGNMLLLKIDTTGSLNGYDIAERPADMGLYYTSAAYLILNTGDALHLLYNRIYSSGRLFGNVKRAIFDYRYDGVHPSGALPLRIVPDTDNWMLGLGRQTGPRTIIVPCERNGNLLFARLEF